MKVESSVGPLGLSNSPSLSKVESALMEINWASLPVVERNLTNVEQLGTTRNGVVIKGISRASGDALACKIVFAPTNTECKEGKLAKKSLEWEYKGYSQCSHKGIHTVTDYVVEGDFCYLFSPMMDFDLYELQDIAGNLSYSSGLNISKRIVEAVRYLHIDKAICHMDIKPENIFVKVPGNKTVTEILLNEKIDELEIKLADFGFWTHCRDEAGKVRRLKGECGSFGYSAPEVTTIGYDGAKADIWSLGRTLFVLLVGFPSWEIASVSHDAYYATWMEGDHVSFWEAIDTHCQTWEIPDSFKHLMTYMMHRDPTMRLTADQVESHPFFSGEVIRFSPSRNQWKVERSNSPSRPY